MYKDISWLAQQFITDEQPRLFSCFLFICCSTRSGVLYLAWCFALCCFLLTEIMHFLLFHCIFPIYSSTVIGFASSMNIQSFPGKEPMIVWYWPFILSASLVFCLCVLIFSFLNYMNLCFLHHITLWGYPAIFFKQMLMLLITKM